MPTVSPPRISKRTLEALPVQGKRVLVRVDYNVPLNDQGAITDDTRIRETLPTLNYLLDKGAALILCAHLGRPKGKPNPLYSLQPVAKRLESLLRRPVQMAADCIGEKVEQSAHALKPGEVLLLENLRFHPEEEANDPAFARALAALGDLYVDDAFGSAHRAHASTVGVAAYLPAVSGLLMQKELAALGNALDNPACPFAAVIGGAKVSSKLGVLQHLLTRVNLLLIGGGMANTFLYAQGYSVGQSLLERDLVETARALLEE